MAAEVRYFWVTASLFFESAACLAERPAFCFDTGGIRERNRDGVGFPPDKLSILEL